MMNRKSFKKLLVEWTDNLINEISIKSFKEQFPEFDISIFPSQLTGNVDYLEVIKNSIEDGQSHNPEAYLEQFLFFKNILTNKSSNINFSIEVFDGENISLRDKLKSGNITATYNDIEEFQQARNIQRAAIGKLSNEETNSFYENILDQKNPSDFEKISEDSNWIIYYPKNTNGSISLAKSYWDGSRLVYDKSFHKSSGYGDTIGSMKWCTAVTSAKNKFNRFYNQKNHMYYCIKKNVEESQYDEGQGVIDDKYRKICVTTNSIIKKENIKKFKDLTKNKSLESLDFLMFSFLISEISYLNVDSNNVPIEVEDIPSIVGINNFKKILKDTFYKVNIIAANPKIDAANETFIYDLEELKENLSNSIDLNSLINNIRKYKGVVAEDVLNKSDPYDEDIYEVFLNLYENMQYGAGTISEIIKENMLAIKEAFKEIGLDPVRYAERFFDDPPELGYYSKEDVLELYPELNILFSLNVTNESFLKEYIKLIIS